MKNSNREYQLSKYDNNPLTKLHLLTLVNILTNNEIMGEFEGKLGEYWTNKNYVALTMPIMKPEGKKWAWIDTKKDDYYNFYIESTDIKEEMNTFSNINIPNDNIVLNDRWTKLVIKNDFNIFQEEFINFLRRRYSEYKRYKLDGNSDISNLK